MAKPATTGIGQHGTAKPLSYVRPHTRASLYTSRTLGQEEREARCELCPSWRVDVASEEEARRAFIEHALSFGVDVEELTPAAPLWETPA
jgi:hypothetical protein